MNENVKRRYRSDLRAKQAATTRRAIVHAAGQLFVTAGFGATTVDAVAAEAGVSRKTVFAAVGGKVDMLRFAIEWAVAGDDEPVPLQERPEVCELLALTDPVALLRAWAGVLVDIDARVAALWRALDVAAELDDQARELHSTLSAQRLTSARTVIDRLIEIGTLRDDVSRTEARDIAWLAGDPALFDRLVRQRRWAVGRFETWLAAHLVSELLGDVPRRSQPKNAAASS